VVSKKLTIREHIMTQEYYYEYLFEGESEDKIDKGILEYVKSWYDSPIDEIDEDSNMIDFGFATIGWWTESCSREKFIESLIGDSIKRIE